MDSALFSLMDLAVAEAKLAPPRPRWRVVKKKPPVWTSEEAALFRELSEHHDYDEIARRMGRSVTALLVMRKRLDIPAPSRHPDWITGYQASVALGVDIHNIMALHERGLMPLEWTPGRSIRRIRRIRRVSLYVWAITPRNWNYFRVHQMQDLHLRRLVELAQARWGDRWLTIGEMTRRLDVSEGVLNNPRHTEWMTRQDLAVRWGNWWIRESAEPLLRARIRPQGKQGVKVWTPRADAFLIRAWNEGVWRLEDIAARMKIPFSTLRHHVDVLRGQGVLANRPNGWHVRAAWAHARKRKNAPAALPAENATHLDWIKEIAMDILIYNTPPEIATIEAEERMPDPDGKITMQGVGMRGESLLELAGKLGRACYFVNPPLTLTLEQTHGGRKVTLGYSAELEVFFVPFYAAYGSADYFTNVIFWRLVAPEQVAEPLRHALQMAKDNALLSQSFWRGGGAEKAEKKPRGKRGPYKRAGQEPVES